MSKVDLSLTWVFGPDGLVCKSGDGRFAFIAYDHPGIAGKFNGSTVEPVSTTKGHKEPSHDVLVM